MAGYLKKLGIDVYKSQHCNEIQFSVSNRTLNSTLAKHPRLIVGQNNVQCVLPIIAAQSLEGAGLTNVEIVAIARAAV